MYISHTKQYMLKFCALVFWDIAWPYLVFGQVSRGTLHVTFSHEEEQVVAVDRLLLLEEEVAHEQVCPVSGSLQHHEATICKHVLCQPSLCYALCRVYYR